MKKTLVIFQLNGHLGAMVDVENGVFRNDVKDPEELGYIIVAENTSITESAYKLAKELFSISERRGQGDFMPMMAEIEGEEKLPLFIIIDPARKGHFYLTNKKFELPADCSTEVFDYMNIVSDAEISIPENFEGACEYAIKIKNMSPIERLMAMMQSLGEESIEPEASQE